MAELNVYEVLNRKRRGAPAMNELTAAYDSYARSRSLPPGRVQHLSRERRWRRTETQSFAVWQIAM
jgi:hypothetical protein